MRKIRLLIPDLPLAESLLPWLQRIDAERRYANFGPLVQELELTLARHWPVAAANEAPAPLQVQTLNSGTAPLELAIAAMDLPAAGEVLLPAYTYPASAASVLRNGMQAVFADVAADTWQLSPALARAVAERRPLAMVMPVATYGCPLDVAAWDAFVDDTGIPVLMDAAAAFGNQAVGRRAHATFSLHATKPFGIGEGGLLVTRDAELAARVRRLFDSGFSQGRVLVPGTNAKLSEYAAAVALAQWQRWSGLQARRRLLWERYRETLASLPGILMQSGFENGALPASVVLRLPVAAEQAANALAESGVETRRWYWPPLQKHPAFVACPVFAPEASAGMAVTEQLAEYSLGLPWHNFLLEEDLLRIKQVLADALGDVA